MGESVLVYRYFVEDREEIREIYEKMCKVEGILMKENGGNVVFGC